MQEEHEFKKGNVGRRARLQAGSWNSVFFIVSVAEKLGMSVRFIDVFTLCKK